MKRRINNFAGFRPAFTLIELVVAMAMVAVVALSLYSTVHTSFGLQRSADLAIEPSDTVDMAMELIGADLENAISPNTTITNAVNIYDVVTPSAANNTGSSSAGNTGGMGSGAGAGGGSSSSANAAPAGWVLAGPFEGTQAQGAGGMETDDLVLFTTADATPHVDGNGEIKMVELTVEQPQGSSDECLVRRVTSNLTQEEPAKPDEEILCRGVTGFSLQYFDGSEWNPTWDSTQEDNTIPAAVQVTLNISRPYNNGQPHTLVFTRVFPISCSNAAMDSNVSTATGL
jgi:prepilin-type N-terminal cleavage/methylation domain-containing protein